MKTIPTQKQIASECAFDDMVDEQVFFARANEIAKLKASIRALIEVYAPPERKPVLLREHLAE